MVPVRATPLVAAVAHSLADPDLSLRDVARLHGCALSYVVKISGAIGLTEALCASAPSTGDRLLMQGQIARERDLAAAAWAEWKVGLSLRGSLIAQPRPPRWFVEEELGFSVSEGPSLSWTCRSLARQNGVAVRALGREAPDRVTYPRDFERSHTPRARRKTQIAKTDRQRRAGTMAQLVTRALSRARESWECDE